MAHTIFAYAVSAAAFPRRLTTWPWAIYTTAPKPSPGPCPIRYSGSPLQASYFGETTDQKASPSSMRRQGARPNRGRSPAVRGRRCGR